MKCNELEYWLSLFASGDHNKNITNLLKKHLAQCKQCNELVRKYKEQRELISDKSYYPLPSQSEWIKIQANILNNIGQQEPALDNDKLKGFEVAWKNESYCKLLPLLNISKAVVVFLIGIILGYTMANYFNLNFFQKQQITPPFTPSSVQAYENPLEKELYSNFGLKVKSVSNLTNSNNELLKNPTGLLVEQIDRNLLGNFIRSQITLKNELIELEELYRNLKPGAIILEFNNKPLKQPTDLHKIMKSLQNESENNLRKIHIKLLIDGKVKEIKLK